MKLFTIILSLSVLSACSVTEDQAVKFTAVPDSNLQQLQNTRFDRFVVNPQTDFSQYDEVIFFPTQFDKLTVDESANNDLTNSWNDSTWDEMDKICQHFDDFAQLTFEQKSGLKPTNRGGDNVLAIEFRLMNFMPYQRRYKDANRDTVVSRGHRNGLGSITFQAVVANSKTGELLAVIEDGMELNPGNMLVIKGDPNLQVDSASPVAQNIAWRKTFRRIADRLHNDLMRLKQS
ncbi:DUF3313 family protein [Alteromonas gilva]|uniref:DUF3313 family protein n=1 Tax=Alteromonas gilva TaxID=2987522 RepID=A0ABT5L0V7_9ALTE|nr:DUF3313 family protein [Alteromonas gilva]MDC8829507.1 DUF3313 family protein [Alteromonas gilva]